MNGDQDQPKVFTRTENGTGTEKSDFAVPYFTLLLQTKLNDQNPFHFLMTVNRCVDAGPVHVS
jgi:hypothetical protein